MSDSPSLRDMTAQLHVEREKLMDEARPLQMEKLARRGTGSARARITELVDKASFSEIGALVLPVGAGPDDDRARHACDGVVVGTARIGARPVVVAAQDFTVFGGSIGRNTNLKVQRAAELALSHGMPLVLLLDSGGGRIPEALDAQYFANTYPLFHMLGKASGWVPIVALMLGAGFAGPTNYAGLADLVVMVRGRSTMGIAGPALVNAGIGKTIDAQELGGADVQVDQNGLADLAVDSEVEAFKAARRFLSYLPSNARADIPWAGTSAVASDGDRLLDIVPINTRQMYDMRAVIEQICDTGTLFEIKPSYAANVITALARLGGRSVGIIGNQPMRLGGMLEAKACEKMAHFIALCDAYGLPLVSLIDVPGFSIGPLAEKSMLGRRSAKLLHEWAHATVPRASVVIRKGYGLGYFAMCGGRSFAADACFAWPTAEISAMSIEGAVDVAFREEFGSAKDPVLRRKEIVTDLRSRTNALRAASGFGIDEVIDPRETRDRLIGVFETAPRRRQIEQPPKFRSIVPI